MPQGETFHIITAGSATQDVFAQSKRLTVIPHSAFPSGFAECLDYGSKNDVEDVWMATGGGATNAAATFSHLGFSTAVLCELGDDAAATTIQEELSQLAVHDFCHRNRGKKTALSIILSTPGADRTILTFRGASAHFESAHFPLARLQADWWYITSLSGNIPAFEALLTRALASGGKVAWNPGKAELMLGMRKLEKLLRRIHVLIVNREEAMQLLGVSVGTPRELGEQLRGRSEYTVITDGREGAWVFRADGGWHARPRPVKVVNTTGAGDAFGSGFVAGLERYGVADKALQLAVLNSEGTIGAVGAKNGLLRGWPNRHTLDSVHLLPL